MKAKIELCGYKAVPVGYVEWSRGTLKGIMEE